VIGDDGVPLAYSLNIPDNGTPLGGLVRTGDSIMTTLVLAGLMTVAVAGGGMVMFRR